MKEQRPLLVVLYHLESSLNNVLPPS